MNYKELPIFRAPQEEKVNGFELVEKFFHEASIDLPSSPLTHEDIYLNGRGIYQALSLLIDFGHLSAANVFIKANPLILKTAFKLKKIVEDEAGNKIVADGYDEFSPILMIAPYLVRKDISENENLRVRPLFYKYRSNSEIVTRYSREELSETLSLWFKLGVEVVSFKNENEVSYSIISLALDMGFSTTYVDKIFKHTLSSPMYDGQYKESLCIELMTKLSQSFVIDGNEDTANLSSSRYVALCANAYLKYGGETLFDKDKVKGGNITEINSGLSPYIASDIVGSSGFAELKEIFFILLNGIDILDGPTVLQENAMRLVMEFNGLGPMDALGIVKSKEQRDMILHILKS
jgi:hypothetical protein